VWGKSRPLGKLSLVPGEFDFIEWVRAQQRPSEFVPVPPGDDLAALKWSGDDLLLVGADQVLDGVHFDSAVHSPRQIGRKAMNRNLSDCAAMACLPAAAVATAALPRGTSLDYAKELHLGLQEAAAPFDCPVVGGDTATWDGKLALSVTILGKSAGVKPIVRCCAKPGDGIYVTGPLGGSILGRHMTFEPRVNTARKLASLGSVTAMIDLSDGLSRDLGHICRSSNVGAVVLADLVPVHEDAIEMRRDGRTPLEHALHDGEDYELLFTGPPAFYFASTRVGTITEEPGIFLQTTAGAREPLEARGWEHRM
jgi:thiamine-monophosphate kinase